MYIYEQMTIINVVMNYFIFDSFRSVSVIQVLSCQIVSKCLIKIIEAMSPWL